MQHHQDLEPPVEDQKSFVGHPFTANALARELQYYHFGHSVDLQLLRQQHEESEVMVVKQGLLNAGKLSNRTLHITIFVHFNTKPSSTYLSWGYITPKSKHQSLQQPPLLPRLTEPTTTDTR